MTEDRISEWASDCASQIGHFLAFRRDTGEVSVKIGETIQKAVSEALEEVQPYIVAMSDPMRESGRMVEYLEGRVCQLRAALDEIEDRFNLGVVGKALEEDIRAIIAKTREGAEK